MENEPNNPPNNNKPDLSAFIGKAVKATKSTYPLRKYRSEELSEYAMYDVDQNDELIAQIKVAVPDACDIRVIPPNMAITLDHSSGRLNVHLEESEDGTLVVSEIGWG